MKLLAVNVSQPREIEFKGKRIRTGIFKAPVDGRVAVRTLNIDGDGQADLIGHGGPFRAVLVYSIENYAFWAEQLGRDDFAFGQFGENLTVEGMLDDTVRVGDRYRIGTALFEVSQPRVPCYKLAMKMGVDGFYNQILTYHRPGFYFRVLEEGDVGAGDAIERVYAEADGMSVRVLSDLLYLDKDDLEGARRAMDIAALSPGWRDSFAKRFAKAQQASRLQEPYRTLTVMRKVRESETITSFYLDAADGRPLAPFLPGQFLPLRIDVPGQEKPAFRTYSLSDAPGAGYYRLTIKREPAPAGRPDLYPGVASNFFHDHVDSGTELQARAPRGTFHLDAGGDRPVVLVSAGVGLTPPVSMLNAIAQGGGRSPVWFIHGARSGREHALGDHVRRVAAEHGAVKAHVRYSRPGAEDVRGRHYDDVGHVDVELVRALVPGPDCDFYLCGPAPFMRALFTGLLDWGVAESRIYYEFFGPASALGDRSRVTRAKRLAQASQCCTEIDVSFSKSGLSAKWNDSYDSILDLAEAYGLSPDYSCRSGICQTCVSPLERGKVEYVQEPLDPPDEGSVLICCAKPNTAVVVGI